MNDSPGNVDLSFPKKNRLLLRSEFKCTLDQGHKIVGHFFVLVACKQIQEKIPRIGLVVSKKVGNAVQRNKVKRSLREAFRHLKDPFSKYISGYDLVLIARHRSHGVGTEQATKELRWLFRALGQNSPDKKGLRPLYE